MSVADALRSRLGVSSVTDIIGQNIFSDRVPDSAGAPTKYVVYQEISGIPDNHLEGHSGLDRYAFQVSCIGPSPDVARQIRAAARAAAIASDGETFRSFVENARTQYLPEVKKVDAQFDIVIWFRET